MSDANWWAEYRQAWRRRPWLALVGLAAVVCLVLALVGTVARDLLQVLFVPGLGLLYYHHTLVKKSVV